MMDILELEKILGKAGYTDLVTTEKQSRFGPTH